MPMFFEDEGADAVEPVVETPAAEPAAPAEWDGAWEKLDTQDWWKAVPESARGHFSKLREEHEVATSRAEYLDRIFNQDDSLAAVRAELETTQTELKGLKESLAAAQGEATTHKERVSALEAQLAEREQDAAFDAMAARYPDIFADVHFLDEKKEQIDEKKGAYPRFVKLLTAGWDEAEAAEAARALLKAPAVAAPAAPPAQPKERDVKPPPSIAAASPGGSHASTVVSVREANEDYEARRERLRREAEAEEGPRPRR